MKNSGISLIVCLLTLIPAVIKGQEQAVRTGNEWPKTDTHTWLVHPHAQAVGLGGRPNVYTHLKEALMAADSLQRIAPEGTFSDEKPLTIWVAPWVYWMDDPDDPSVRRPLPGEGIPYGLKLKLSHLHLKGMGEKPEHTVVACNRGQTQGAVGNFTMFHLTGEDLLFENLTMGNYCNIDLVYPPAPQLNRPKRAQAIVQAQLAICQGDRIAARKCRFISRLNLCPLVGARRVFFDECYFECTDDALCGTGVYHRCRFIFFSGKPFYITQGTGAVFLDCDIHALTRGTQYLTKVESPVTMVDCRWTSEQPDLNIEWTSTPSAHLRCYQYGLQLNGQPLDIHRKQTELGVEMEGRKLLETFRLTLPKQLFDPSAVGDTLVYNLFNLTKGEDGWNPAGQPALMKNYAGGAVALRMNLQRKTLESEVDTLRLSVEALGFMQRPGTSNQRNRGISWKVMPDSLGNLVETEVLADGSLRVIGRNGGEESRSLQIVAMDESGLEAASTLTVRPRQLPPPAFLKLPKIHRKGNLLTADYRLDLQGRTDQSDITWWRCSSSDGAGAIPVAVSRKNNPERTYRLMAEDDGYYLMVTVAPKHRRSAYGISEKAVMRKPMRSKESETKEYETDFSDFPTQRQTRLLPGFWTIDAYKPADTREFEWEADTLREPWIYGRGVDGACEEEGLMQAVRGARLLYTPLPGKYRAMEMTLHVAPCKSAGQGFGSATGQYMDVCLKMDTYTLSGYALRIIRTTKHDNAVDFQLMKYENGIVSPISEAVSSICYRRGCVIRLKATESELTAHIFNEQTLPAPHSSEVVGEVNLSAPIADTPYGGIGIQHTGSTGASATLLTKMSVRWN